MKPLVVGMIPSGKSSHRRRFVDSVPFLASLVTILFVSLTHILFKVPYDVTKVYVESRMERIDRNTDKLLVSYRKLTGRYMDVHDSLSGDDRFHTDADYSYIYANRSANHVTFLVTTTRCAHSYHVLLLITSDLDNFGRRQSIRLTWGEDPTSDRQKWKTYFLVGRRNGNNNQLRRLAREIRRYGDIILGDSLESFYNLSLKLQMGFEWSYKYCDYDFLMKGDDDVFVNIPRLFDFVDDVGTPKHSLYAGNAHYVAVVGRDGRYGMSKKEYSKDIYPRYCSGGGFILTRDVVKKFNDVISTVHVIKIDDAYIGELALKAGIDVFHNDNFQMFESRYRCLFRTNAIVHHPVKTGECMKLLYEKTVLFIIEMGKLQTSPSMPDLSVRRN